MNLIQRVHGLGSSNVHGETAAHAHDAPFWVRHYDLVTNLVTLGRTKSIHRQTLSLAALHAGDAVLDIGCGTGALALEAERIVGPDGTVVGLDVESAMIEQARDRARRHDSRARFDIASVERIPYAEDTFDVAFSTLMYHHLSETQRDALFVETARVLKSGGRLVLVDINPSRRNILTSLPGHSRLVHEDYVLNEVTERMRTAGFTVAERGAHPSRQLSYAIGQKAE